MNDLDPAASQFVRRVLDAARASESGRGIFATLEMAGCVVRLRFTNAKLMSLFQPAFEHLRVADDTSPDVTLHIMEGEPFPSPAWPAQSYRSCGEVVGFANNDIYLHVDIPLAAISVLDLEAHEGAYWIRSTEVVPSYERSAPFRALLHRWFMSNHIPLAHVGAVADRANAALIIGAKGAGKSTTSLACLALGMDFLGDDRCGIDVSGLEPVVWSIYSTAKVFDGELDRFGIPRFSETAIPPTTAGDTKMLSFVHEVAAARLRSRAPIKLIVQPRRSRSQRSHLSRMPASEAVKTLASDLLGRSPATAPLALGVVAKLCRMVPSYYLETSNDPSEVASFLRGLLRSDDRTVLANHE
jgi:hypothetical protein